MKNLKKVLALVLALATVMGLGITASAKTYTDSNKIEYTEAVDVMSEIGILAGNPDGSFNPQGNLTRVQAAKMVAYLLNGGKDVNDLYSGANTFVDCYSNWGKGYIAYVNQMGIVSGVGNGKFNPNGTLTGVALAKMMLTSLGYDAKIEGYVNNNNWMVNIINDAKDAGLLAGLDDVNLYNAITREQASQMMFNALKANMVEYSEKGTEITLPGLGTIVTGASAPKAVKTSSNNTWGRNIIDDLSGTEYTVQLGEKYFSKLVRDAATDKTDDYGRPAVTWIYDGKPVGDYATVDAKAVYTSEVTGGKLYTDLGRVTPDTVKIVRNGVPSSEGATVKGTIKSGDKTVLNKSGNGVVTEVYYDSASKTATIVQVTQAVGKITGFTAAKVNSDGEVTDKAYITISIENGADKDTVTFETDAYTKEDVNKTYVTLTYIGSGSAGKVGTVKSVNTATSETVVPTRINADGTFVANGTTYKYATMIKNQVAQIAATSVTNKTEVTLYFDAYGNVVRTSAPESASTLSYAYVIKTVQNGGDIWESKPMAQLLLADGNVVAVETATYANLDGQVVSYTVKNDVYTLSNATALAESADAELSIDKGVAAGKVDDTDVFFGGKTIFMVISKNSDGKDVYNVYTGINNVPNLDGDTATKAVAVTDGKATGAKKIADVVVVKDAKSSSSSTSDTYYVVGDSSVKAITDVDLGTYYEYNAVVNGEITTIKTTEQLSDVKFVQSVSMNDKGIITGFGTPVDYKTPAAAGTVEADAGLIGFGNGSNITYATYASDCTVYMIKDGKVTASSVDSIATDTNDTVVYTMKDNVVTAIYVTEK